MGKAWIAIGVVLVTLVAGAMGYTIASAVLTFKALGFSADIDFGYIAQNYLWIRDRRPDDFQLINLIIGDIPDARNGFTMYFSASPFPGFQKKIDWVREDSGGNWYRMDDPQVEGWLCPALFKYFNRAPDSLYVMAEDRNE